jgi:hypothetical protein
MRYFASVYAYDVMDQVSITVAIRSQGDTPETPITTELTIATTVPGTGESDPRKWAMDALVAALETL